MTEDRFHALADAYGGDIRRWPEAERAAAANFARDHGLVARRVLAREQWLDAALDASALGEPSPALRQRIIEAAPRGRTASRAWRWLAAAGLGLGLASACASGVVAGMTLAPASITRMISGPAASEPADGLTALIDPPVEPDDA